MPDFVHCSLPKLIAYQAELEKVSKHFNATIAEANSSLEHAARGWCDDVFVTAKTLLQKDMAALQLEMGTIKKKLEKRIEDQKRFIGDYLKGRK